MISANRHRIGNGVRVALVTGLIGLQPLAATAAQGPRPQFQGSALIVNYADLDINSPSGAERLYERIEQAAAQLCPQVSFVELARYAASLRCRNVVVADAVSRINSPQLAAIYASRSHRGARSPV